MSLTNSCDRVTTSTTEVECFHHPQSIPRGVPFCIPISHMWQYQLICMLSILYIISFFEISLDILMAVQWYLVMFFVWFCSLCFLNLWWYRPPHLQIEPKVLCMLSTLYHWAPPGGPDGTEILFMCLFAMHMTSLVQLKEKFNWIVWSLIAESF